MDLRAVARPLVFPAVLTLALGAAVWGLARGVHPALLVGGCTLLVAAVLIPLERWLPYTSVWREAKGDVVVDALHGAVSMGLAPKLIEAASLGGATWLSIWVAERLGVALWPADLPLLIQLPLALLVAELGSYWLHRWMHTTPLLWRVHALHHSAERLYWLNAGRFHPLDPIITYPAQVLPLVVLGAGPEVLVLFSVFTSAHGMMQHANVDVRLGPLNHVFSMAELHRWHHSRKLEEANSNYGSNLIIWDTVFGTRFLPADRRAGSEVGLAADADFPRDYWGHLTSPFTWKG